MMAIRPGKGLDPEALMNRILSRAGAPLIGVVAVPGDKSISHRAALLALLAGGPCRADGWLDSADTRSSLEAVRALGAEVRLSGDVLTFAVTTSGGKPDVA